MIFQTKLTLSSTNRKYINVDVDAEYLDVYIKQLKLILGYSYEKYNQNRITRSDDLYHMTVIGPNEFKDNHLEVTNIPIEIQFCGLGKASNEKNTSFFVVCKSNVVNSIRDNLVLPLKDLHITLGFDNTDVHNANKGKKSIIWTLPL